MAKLKDSRVYGNLQIDDILLVSNDATILGNLNVQGTVTTVNSTTVQIEGPIVQQGAGANGSPLTSNDGLDRGLDLSYYNGGQKEAFMGWNTANSEFRLASDATIVGDIVTFNTYGNVRAGVFFGDGGGLSNIVGGNVTGTVSNATTAVKAGTVTANAQPNVTSVGTLTSLAVGTSDAATIDANGNISTSGSITANGSLSIGIASGPGANTANADIYGNLNVTGNLNGRFTGTIGAKGSDTYIQFNDGGNQNGVAGFTFDKTSNTVEIGGTNIVLNGSQGDANIGNSVNFTNGSINGAGVGDFQGSGGIDLYAPGSINYTQLNFDNTTYVYANGTEAAFQTDGGGYQVKLDNSGVFTIPGNLQTNNGNFAVDENGNVNAVGYGSFAQVYDTGLTQNQVVFPGSDGKLGGSAGLTYASNTLSANNFATTNANIQGNITTSNKSGNLLMADSTSGNIVDSNVSMAGGQLSVSNISVTNNTQTGNLRVTNLGTTGALLFTADIGGNVTESSGLIYSANTLNANNFTTAGNTQTANLTVTSITQTEVVYATTGGKLVGDAGFTFDGVTKTLSANNISSTGNIEGGNVIADNLTGTEVVFSATGGKLVGDTSFTFAADTLSVNNVSILANIEAGNVIADNLTGTEIVFAGTGGKLVGDTSFTFAADTLSVNNISTTNKITAGNVYANSGTIGASLLTGTLTTAYQPNVTGVGTLGNLTVTGNANVGGLLTDNLYYANGTAWDLQQAAGINNQIQFNTGDNFDASSNFTFDPVANLLTVNGDANITGSANIGTNINLYDNGVLNFTQGGSYIGEDGALVVHGESGLALETGGTTNDITITTNGNQFKFDHTGNTTLPSGGTADLGNLAKATYAAFSTKTVTPTVESPDSIDLTLRVKSTHVGGNVVLWADHANGGTVEVSGAKITGLAEPTLDTDAATKYYVDHVAQGLHVHGPAAVASTANIAGFSGGSFGSLANPFILDGYTVQDQDRVLVKDQVTQSQNGIYVYSSSGNSLTRADDSNTAAEFAGGDFCFVVNGDTQGDTGWVQTEVVTTLGSDPISFSQFSGAGSYTADENAGMHINGTVFSTKINTDTMDYDGTGNLKVADSAIFVTPNIGIATGTSLNLTGNLHANNANFGGVVFAQGNITLGAGSFVNGNVNGNISGNITVSGTVGALQFAGAGNTLTSDGNLNFYTSNVTLQVGDGSTTGNVIANLLTGTLTTSAQPNITSVGTLGNLSVTSNVSAGNVKTDNLLHTDGTPWDFATAAGPQYSIQISDGTDLANVTGFTYSSGNLNVPGNIVTGSGTGGNISGANVISAITLSATGDVSGATLTGSLTTANQSNITTVGTLGSLDVTNDITSLSGTILAGNIGNSTTYLHGDGSNISNISGSNVSEVSLATHVTGNAQGNITSVGTLTSLNVSNTGGTGNITADSVFANSGIVSGLYLYGDGSNISSITGANVTGYVPNANIANVAYDVNGSNISGTSLNSNILSSNLTSVGTLTDLTVAGNIIANTGKILAGQIGNSSSYLYGDGSNITGVTASSINAGNLTGSTLSSNVTSSSLTSLGTLTALTVNGPTNLGDVANVEIDGGTSGQYLQTDGAGTLSWATVDLTEIVNGSSNVRIATSGGNVTVGVGGTAGVISVATTGLTVTGIITSTGNITGNNITANNFLTVSGTSDATSAITGAIKTSGGISAEGNIYAGKAVGFANSAGNTDSAAYIQFNSGSGSLDFIFN